MKFATLFFASAAAQGSTGTSTAAPAGDAAATTPCTNECAWQAVCVPMDNGETPCKKREENKVRCTLEGKVGDDGKECSMIMKDCKAVDPLKNAEGTVEALDSSDTEQEPKMIAKCKKVHEHCKLDKTDPGNPKCMAKFPKDSCKCPAEKLGVAMVFFLAAVTTFM